MILPFLLPVSGAGRPSAVRSATPTFLPVIPLLAGRVMQVVVSPPRGSATGTTVGGGRIAVVTREATTVFRPAQWPPVTLGPGTTYPERRLFPQLRITGDEGDAGDTAHRYEVGFGPGDEVRFAAFDLVLARGGRLVPIGDEGTGVDRRYRLAARGGTMAIWSLWTRATAGKPRLTQEAGIFTLQGRTLRRVRALAKREGDAFGISDDGRWIAQATLNSPAFRVTPALGTTPGKPNRPGGAEWGANLGARMTTLRVSDDGERAAAGDDGTAITVYGARGRTSRRLTMANPSVGAFSPKGRRFATAVLTAPGAKARLVVATEGERGTRETKLPAERLGSVAFAGEAAGLCATDRGLFLVRL